MKYFYINPMNLSKIIYNGWRMITIHIDHRINHPNLILTRFLSSLPLNKSPINYQIFLNLLNKYNIIIQYPLSIQLYGLINKYLSFIIFIESINITANELYKYSKDFQLLIDQLFNILKIVGLSRNKSLLFLTDLNKLFNYSNIGNSSNYKYFNKYIHLFQHLPIEYYKDTRIMDLLNDLLQLIEVYNYLILSLQSNSKYKLNNQPLPNYFNIIVQCLTNNYNLNNVLLKPKTNKYGQPPLSKRIRYTINDLRSIYTDLLILVNDSFNIYLNDYIKPNDINKLLLYIDKLFDKYIKLLNIQLTNILSYDILIKYFKYNNDIDDNNINNNQKSITNLYQFILIIQSINNLSNINSRYSFLSNNNNNNQSLSNPYKLALSDILNSNLTSDNKQIRIELLQLKYEFNFLNNYILTNDTQLKYKILYDYAGLIDQNINNLLSKWVINNYQLLNKLFYNLTNNNTKSLINDQSKLVSILTLIIAKDIIPSLLIFNTLQIINNPIKSVNYTIKLGNKLVEYCLMIINNSDIQLSIDPLIIKYYTNHQFIDKEYLNIGVTLLAIINKHTNLIEEYNYKESNDEHPSTYLRINPLYIDKFKCLIFNIHHLPMVAIPNKWSIKSIGGYYTERMIKNYKLIRTNPYNIGITSLNSIAYETINYLNKQRFIINKPLLNILLNEWNNKDSLLFHGYNNLHPLTPNINDYLSNSKIYKQIIEHNNHYWQYYNILTIAELYKDIIFYLPVYYDFRGRIYTLNNYLTYQGTDLARSLILFADSIEITNDNVKYLKYYCCNTFNSNKYNLEDKIIWVNDNINKLLYDIDNNNYQYIIKAKEPFQFLSTILQFKSNYTNIPILFDASCNGLQHLSAMC